MEKGKREINLYAYKLFMLICIEIMFAFSSMGYIVIEPISITFMHVPVIVGAMLLGPFAGAVLGGIFGFTSMWKATVSATAYADMVFSPFGSGAPVQSLLLSVGTRVLFGLCAGLMFVFVKNYVKHKRLGVAVVSLVAVQLHSLLVHAAMQFMFPDAGMYIADSFAPFYGLSELLGTTITLAVPLLVYELIRWPFVHRLEDAIMQQQMARTAKSSVAMAGLLVVIVLMINSLVTHCYLRMSVVISSQVGETPPELWVKLPQILTQLTVALAAFCGLVFILMMVMESVMRGLANEARSDMMTGLLNKTSMEQLIECTFTDTVGAVRGAFVMLDIDYFKQINDQYGHPFGDKVLLEVADILKGIFSQNDFIGRVGGDEFGILCKEEMTDDELRALGDKICRKVRQAHVMDNASMPLTCSVGIVRSSSKESFMQLYEEVDRQLYRSKHDGRNRYSIAPAVAGVE